MLTGMAMGSAINDKGAGEKVLRQSDLDWTIIYASVLTDGPATGATAVLPETASRGFSQRISRADVAAWMIQAASSAEQSHRSVGITGGTQTGA
jgi:uncharacterized protein YbjT (DUF2867 family)